MKKDSLLILILTLFVLILVTLTALTLMGRRSTEDPLSGMTDKTPIADPWVSGMSPTPSVSRPQDSTGNGETDPPSPPDSDTSSESSEVTDPSTEPESNPTDTDPPVQNVIRHDYVGSLPASASVENDWFADALFIGDSRTVGMASYSGIKSTYYAKTSLNISTAFTDQFITDVNGNKSTILKAIEANPTYKKVYLWFGLNDVGGNRTSFITKYKKLIQEIQELLPDAQIYIHSICPVSKRAADTSIWGVTNENIYSFNTAIAELADTLDVYFINSAEAFSDETGALRSKTLDDQTLSNDGIHFTKPGVLELFDYLRSHTVATNA